ncbi:hypothetical protein [Nocardia farcinica]|uniref:hypothetical protein n=1 Tax=Nocardia farcinica TaxID=37329 RepID=UPI0018940470|nr:hypothetical protein [Nocardia farcinica]MBF6187620.1 hypothetical protein [Nocardia farcinica]MBF6410984.1 hypothetical protein [Nocardia farcinica]
MIREVTYYQVICDGCGVSAHEASDFDAWGKPVDAVFEAEGFGWLTPNIEGVNPRIEAPDWGVGGPHYCPDCAPNQEGQADA